MTKQQWQGSPRYRALKQRVLATQGGECADCGTGGPLDLHHLIYPYAKLVQGRPGQWGDEADADVVCLCRLCHHDRHHDLFGHFWQDPQEMASHWEGWSAAMDKE